MHARRLREILFTVLVFVSISLFTANSLQWQRYFRSVDRQATKNSSEMRILALFSSTANDLGIDHRIGRQVLKLALERAKKVRPEVRDIELIVHSESADCRELSVLPNFVAERFYLQSDQAAAGDCSETGDDTSGNIHHQGDANNMSEFKYIGQTTTVSSAESSAVHQCTSVAGEQDSEELDEYFGESLDKSASREMSRSLNASTKRIDAIIGPSCDPLVDIVARMAAYWRTPIYTVTSINANFGRKDVFSTLTRLSPSIEHLNMFLVRLMKHFKWKHLAILVDRSRIENEILLENLQKTIDNNQHTILIERVVFELEGSNSNKTEPTVQVHNSTTLSNLRKKSLCKDAIRSQLLGATKVARVILLLPDDIKSVRGLLLCAHELEMNNGEYTFITPNLALKSSVGSNTSEQPREIDDKEAKSGGLDWFVADDEANNAKARQMFESLMVLSVEQPVGDEYNAFVEQTLDLVAQSNPSLKFDRSSIGPVAVALHDSLLLAVEGYWRASQSAKSFNQLKTDSGDFEQLDSGEAESFDEAALMWNATYTNGLMTSIHINRDGDQELDYILSDLEPEMGSLRPVASYSKQTRQVQMLPNSYIHWPARFNKGSRELIDSDEAPPDEPECGFDGQAERCIDRQNLYAALTVLAVLIVLTIAATAISVTRYKRIRYQMKLDDFWWRIQWDDLMFVNFAGGSAGGSIISGSGMAKSVILSDMRAMARSDNASTIVSRSKGRTGTSRILSETSSQSPKFRGTARSMAASQLTNRTHLTCNENDASVIRSEYSVIVRQSRIAKFKDEFVIVKQLNSHTVEINRSLLVELKSMRELCQENLARFVGLCVEPGRLAIIGEYCSRGSLKDLLHNESVAMDLTLKYSILGDIINGLNFIHTSLLNFHGRLKSTNLVLDSRFTVKLTDFGLKSLYCQLDAVENQESDSAGADKYLGESSETKSQSNKTSTRRPSMTQTIYQMDSVSMHGEAAGQQQEVDALNVKFKNRGSVRYFWTAPEHLRDKNPHIAGSKKGDIYSLAIIMFELFTRKEPYYYGTNASPNWGALKRVKQKSQKSDGSSNRLRTSRLSVTSAASSQLQLPTSGSRKTSRLSGAGSFVSRQSERARDRMRRSQASVAPKSDLGNVSGASGAKVSAVLQASTPRLVQQPSISVSSVANTPIGEESAVELEKSSEKDVTSRESSASGTKVRSDVSSFKAPDAASDAKHRPASSSGSGMSREDEAGTGVTAAMAEEILDQLRMGVQPEPVRPYVPNSVLQEVDINLIELMRACWTESANVRPGVERVRAKIKKITAGVASKNYLDNLLERLQTYAAELERIVDEKSSDIIAEKARTEELLYQLVPKFVADKLKHNEPIIPQLFDGVTVFFSDIVGFEKYTAVMSPIELVDLLNNIYSSFESIINSFDVIKIEVILDQFLVASGISLQDEGISGAGEHQVPVETGKNNSDTAEANDEKDTDKQSKGTKSTRKLLNALRLTQSVESNTSDDGGNKRQQQVDPSGKHDKEAKQDTGVVMVTSSDRYKRNCAEQIARMALCIRDLVKSFNFRQTLSGSCANPNNDRTTSKEHNVPCETEVSDASAKKSPADDGANPAHPSPKVENIIAATFNIRIGIHSGKVCAGIVGLKRPKFCLIGDTVNVASRMHTNSKANKIQVSADTSHLLQGVPGLFIQPRGKIEVKGKGQMETYWLETAQ